MVWSLSVTSWGILTHVDSYAFIVQWFWRTRDRCAPRVLWRKRNSVPDPFGEGTGVLWSPDRAWSGCHGGGSELYRTRQLPSATHTTLDGNNGNEHTVVEGRGMIPYWGSVGLRYWKWMNTQWLKGGERIMPYRGRVGWCYLEWVNTQWLKAGERIMPYRGRVGWCYLEWVNTQWLKAGERIMPYRGRVGWCYLVLEGRRKI